VAIIEAQKQEKQKAYKAREDIKKQEDAEEGTQEGIQA
jgi:hypothetical protein